MADPASGAVASPPPPPFGFELVKQPQAPKSLPPPPFGFELQTGQTPGKIKEQDVMGGAERYMTGLADPVIGGKQLYTHITGTPQEISAVDQAVQQREQEIARREGGGFLRGLGGATTTAPLMATGIGGLPGAAIGGAAVSALEPTAVKDSADFAQTKARDAIIGGALAAGTGGLFRGGAGLAAPALRPEAAALTQQGVRMTPGQMAGGWTQQAETLLQGLPILGSFIRGAEGRSIGDFNRAVYNQVLEPIKGKLPGKIDMGRDAFDEAAKQVDRAYTRSLTGINFNPDPQLGRDIHMLKLNAGVLPNDQVSHFNRIVDNYLAPLVSGPLTNPGQQYKRVDSALAALNRTYSGSQLAGERDMAHYIRDFRDALRQVVIRQNPGPQAQALKDADLAYAMLSRVRDASTRRATSGGYFSPGDLLQAVKQQDPLKKSVNPNSFSRGGALMQPFAEAAFSVLPNKIPETALGQEVFRMAAKAGGPVALSAAGYEAGKHAGALAPYAETVGLPLAIGGAAASLPYTRAGQAALRALAQPGPTRAKAAAIAKATAPSIGVGSVPIEKEYTYGGPSE